MSVGKGKYEALCAALHEATQAKGSVVIIFGGNQGSDLSVRADAATMETLPEFLEGLANGLREGRLEGIIADLQSDDYSNFQCHKTTHKRGVEPSMCMGSAVYMMKAQRPSVALRFALATRLIALNDLKEHYNAIIEPLEVA